MNTGDPTYQAEILVPQASPEHCLVHAAEDVSKIVACSREILKPLAQLVRSRAQAGTYYF